jgi:hypothetical protein
MLTQYFRIPAGMFQEWEKRSGIPFYTWYHQIEERRSAVEAHMGPLMENLHELFRGTTRDLREVSQQVFDAHAKGKLDDISHISDKSALYLGETSFKFFKRWMMETMGHSEEDTMALLKELPQIRQSGKSFADYRGIRGAGLPKLLTTSSKSFENGEVILSNKEMDTRKNLIRIGRAMILPLQMRGRLNCSTRTSGQPCTSRITSHVQWRACSKAWQSALRASGSSLTQRPRTSRRSYSG